MTREAALFVMAEDIMVEVVGRIRAEHWAIVVAPQLVDDPPTSLRELVQRVARDDASVPDVLAGGTTHGIEPLGAAPHDTVTQLAAKACAAARDVPDGDAAGRAFLLTQAITRSFAAHDVAIHLGSTACPLTEELARGLVEITDPDAAGWRARGVFRDPLPLPPDVSWRDRFLLSAGRDPHPLH